MTVLVSLALASAASAQPAASDDWQVTVAPYFMAAAISGTTGVRGVEADIDARIFDHLKFGGMGLVAARKGNWGLGTDFIFLALGATSDCPSHGRGLQSGGVGLLWPAPPECRGRSQFRPSGQRPRRQPHLQGGVGGAGGHRAVSEQVVG